MELNTDQLVVTTHAGHSVVAYAEEHDDRWVGYVLAAPLSWEAFSSPEAFGERYVDLDIHEAGEHDSAYAALVAARAEARRLHNEEPPRDEATGRALAPAPGHAQAKKAPAAAPAQAQGTRR